MNEAGPTAELADAGMRAAFPPLPPVRVACLVCTNRPEWEPWVSHQIAKQLPYEGAEYIPILAMCKDSSIPRKRTDLLLWAASERADYIAFFDDDDWSPPDRLATALRFLESPTAKSDLLLDAVGSAHSYFVDSRPGELKDARCVRYRAPEGLVFNGAVFRLDAVPNAFNPALTIGEDTTWLGKWFDSNPNYLITGGPMHLWLCHEKNTTNRATERSFDERIPRSFGITEEEWKLVPRG